MSVKLRAVLDVIVATTIHAPMVPGNGLSVIA